MCVYVQHKSSFNKPTTKLQRVPHQSCNKLPNHPSKMSFYPHVEDEEEEEEEEKEIPAIESREEQNYNTHTQEIILEIRARQSSMSKKIM